MKTLTIRLEDEDERRIKAIQSRSMDGRYSNRFYGCTTINGTIRYALKLVEEYTNLHAQLSGLFTQEWKVDQGKLRELNNKYGFLQENLFD